jgi:hypothetical protein
MLRAPSMRVMSATFCALVFTATLPAQANRRDDKPDDTRWLFAVRGTPMAVADFLKRYQDSYDSGYPLRAACDFPMRVDSSNLLFVCDATRDVLDQVSSIYNLSVHSLDLGISTITTGCSTVHCRTNPGAGCSYYSGPYCTTPGCYHTGYYCAGLHSCI